MVEMVNMEEMDVTECLVLKHQQGPPGKPGLASRWTPRTSRPARSKGSTWTTRNRTNWSKESTVTRWGRSSCPNVVAGTELVYTSRAGGSCYSHSGGGASNLIRFSLVPRLLPVFQCCTLKKLGGAWG